MAEKATAPWDTLTLPECMVEAGMVGHFMLGYKLNNKDCLAQHDKRAWLAWMPLPRLAEASSPFPSLAGPMDACMQPIIPHHPSARAPPPPVPSPHLAGTRCAARHHDVEARQRVAGQGARLVASTLWR